MPHHRDDPPCPECGERPGALKAEIERLRSALTWIASHPGTNVEAATIARDALAKKGVAR